MRKEKEKQASFVRFGFQSLVASLEITILSWPFKTFPLFIECMSLFDLSLLGVEKNHRKSKLKYYIPMRKEKEKPNIICEVFHYRV